MLSGYTDMSGSAPLDASRASIAVNTRVCHDKVNKRGGSRCATRGLELTAARRRESGSQPTSRPGWDGRAANDCRAGFAAEGEPGTGALAGISKVVFSTTLREPLSWANTTPRKPTRSTRREL